MSNKNFKKGNPGGPGRPKGLKNKVTAEVKELISYALENMEISIGRGTKKTSYKGREAFLKWCEANPDQFYTKIFPKIIPKPIEVSGKIENENKTTIGLVILPEKTKIDYDKVAIARDVTPKEDNELE